MYEKGNERVLSCLNSTITEERSDTHRDILVGKKIRKHVSRATSVEQGETPTSTEQR